MSIEVVPQYIEHADGRVELSYENAHVINNDYKTDIPRQWVQDQEEDGDFYFDKNSQTWRNKYSEPSQEMLEGLDPDAYEIDPEAYEDDEESYGREFTNEEIEFLYSQVGGQEEYHQLMQFAAANLDSHAIESFDNVIATGDVESSLEAISILVQMYNDYHENDGYDEEEYESEDETSELVDSIYELCGGQESYVSMLRWAADHMNESWIAAFDANMESGDYSLMSSMAQRLQSEFYNYHSAY